MRKHILVTTMVLCLTVGAAMAGVETSKHNFTSPSSSPNAYFLGTRQVCVFCHTPHKADATQGKLFNHEVNEAQTYQMYTSNTMDMTQSVQPHKGSLTCLSCHDGTIAVNSLNNLPGPTAGGNYGVPGGAGLDGAGRLTASSNAYVGTDLGDDHPVGITYDASKDPTGFVSKTGNPANYPDKLLADDLYVECTSCHDPHDDTYANFLVESNSGSQLCKRCHTK